MAVHHTIASSRLQIHPMSIPHLCPSTPPPQVTRSSSSSPHLYSTTCRMTSTSSQKPITASTADFRATSIPKNGETGKAVNTIVSNRKCWRILKGRDEAVWPPALEAALIEGLEKYKPTESRSTRSLGRFPMRNKFISDYIFQTTGKRRTPKQVGSRIQQLRDTSSGKQILKTYSDRHYEMMRPSRPPVLEQDPREQSPESVNSDGYSSSPSPAPQADQVFIHVLPPSSARTSHHHPFSASYQRHSPYPSDDFRAMGPRMLRDINPTVTFTASSPFSCYSSFIVAKDGNVVSSEVTPVEECQPLPSGSSAPAFLYRTTLVPKVWAQLCESEEPELYTISQEIIAVDSSMGMSSHAPNSNILSSITYHFINAAAASRALSPNPSIDGSVRSADSLSSSIRTPDLPADFDDFLALASPLVMDGTAAVLGHRSHESLLPPDLLHYGDDGYSSFPSSPSEVSTLVPWSCYDTTEVSPQVQVQPQLGGCDPYFQPPSMTAVSPFVPALSYDESAISDINLANFF
ncbi:hypothetical protein BXZ70DRAFT_503765 [Cristinia sonorae]|uniref:TEA domain-containing protein n=1 Tax=Cristinia sonorae TaxID=1940300 RepID=A0A8K0UV35_9AGAR|nr:hypothetical protein BXZ70DRAFT_503765 [Cristinia sonorae]